MLTVRSPTTETSAVARPSATTRRTGRPSQSAASRARRQRASSSPAETPSQVLPGLTAGASFTRPNGTPDEVGADVGRPDDARSTRSSQLRPERRRTCRRSEREPGRHQHERSRSDAHVDRECASESGKPRETPRSTRRARSTSDHGRRSRAAPSSRAAAIATAATPPRMPTPRAERRSGAAEARPLPGAAEHDERARTASRPRRGVRARTRRAADERDRRAA